MVRGAMLQQGLQDRQAANRALESEKPQTYFARYENEAMSRLLERRRDDLAYAYIELMQAYLNVEAQVAELRERMAELERTNA